MSKYGLSNRRGRDVVIVNLVFFFVAFISVCLRFQARRLRKMRFSWDDYCVLASLVICCGSIGVSTAMVTDGGVGRHALTEVPLEDVAFTLKLLIAGQILYPFSLGLSKTSLAILYIRIFRIRPVFRYLTYTVLIITWGWVCGFSIEVFTVCRPVWVNWDPLVPGECGNRNAALVAGSALNMGTDIIIMVLPVPHIWSLHLATARKIGLSLLFCLGFFVSIISVIRMKSLLTLDFADVTYSLPLPLMWSVIEPELGLVCANLPVLSPIWAPYLPSPPYLPSHRGATITPLSTSSAANDHFERLQGTSQECSVITGERTSEEFEMEGSCDGNGCGMDYCESAQRDTAGPRIKVKTEVRVEY